MQLIQAEQPDAEGLEIFGLVALQRHAGRDLQAAGAVGCRRILVRTGKGAATQARGIPADLLPVAVHADLAAAVAALLASGS